MLLVGVVVAAIAVFSSQSRMEGQSRATGGDSILINGGAATTTKRDVVLSLNSQVVTTQMRIANSLPELKLAGPVLFQKKIKWTLSNGYGKKTVFASFKAGNKWTTPVYDTIQYLRSNLTPTLVQITLKITPTSAQLNPFFCKYDTDCVCGMYAGQCAYVNRYYSSKACSAPDFCTGITGNCQTRCIRNTCRLSCEQPAVQ